MAQFERGNTASVGNNGGHPPKYETPEDLQKAIDEYFNTKYTKAGKCQPTIEGLTYYLGFATRKSLLDQELRSAEFLNVIKRAKTFIKSCYEQQLYGFAWAGSAFALKNIGKGDWQDEVIQQQNQQVTQVTITEKKREA